MKKYEPDFLKKEYCETIHSGFTYYRYYINYNNKENVYPIWAINREEEVLLILPWTVLEIPLTIFYFFTDSIY